MRVEIDLTTDRVLRANPFMERDLVGSIIVVGFEDGVPENFQIGGYDYIPAISGVYDPNGWYATVPPVQQDNSVIKRQWVTVNTQSNGLFTFAFPSGFFSKTPMVSVTVIATNTRVHSVNVRSVTANSITGVVKRSRLLPSVITALTGLQSYDTFQDTGVVQVQIKAEEIV
jgi:hypothetical protein